ncbi:MAG: hypothetical protein GY953_14295 [bacterium]|nr:hypothetical protein [bacterium]
MYQRRWGFLESALVRAATMILVCTALSGCFRHSYTIGSGPHGGEVIPHKVWYAAWGFVDLSNFDTERVVGGADDFRLKSGFATSDVLLNLLTGPVGFYRQTIRVEK